MNRTHRAPVLGLTFAVGLASTLAFASPGASWAADDAPTPSPSALKTSRLKGWARMYFPAPDNDIQVTVDAHATFDPNGASMPTGPPAGSG
ncbi:hypothetical protein [Nonomuraea sp. NPDC005650]|uniref:hypothetical protein n=1 Tax=Nonomuraea sp. NPDC005650 TaxID=3157045 RepID=UPI0033BD7F1E